MQRRKALAVAAASALTLGAAGLATAANLGLLAHAEEDPVGRLNATNVAELLDVPPGSTPPRVIVVDEPAPAADPAPVAPAAEPPAPVAVEPGAASAPAPVVAAEAPRSDPWVTPAPMPRDGSSPAVPPTAAPRDVPASAPVPTTTPGSGGARYEDSPEDSHPESPDDHPEDDLDEDGPEVEHDD